MSEGTVPQPKGLLQQMEELMAALDADLSALDADLQSAGGADRGPQVRGTDHATAQEGGQA
ncbi:hypothetical protein ACH4C6_19315 [Streptomyces sp. NPDC017943]|uniref:hypothetical protein n=1 Tax=Streptomyces sp. NPDC017943 TaxID=3365019 RepID=UPI0037A8415F